MTHLEFFTALLAEMIGIPKTQVPNQMTEYEKYVESNGFNHADVSPEDMKTIREAIKLDPQLYLSWITDDYDHITMH